MYTVFDMEGDGEFDDAEVGLTLAQAAHRKLVRNGYQYDVRRIDGRMVLLLSDEQGQFPTTVPHLMPTDIRSENPDDGAACVELMRMIVSGAATIGGSHHVVTDQDYLDNLPNTDDLNDPSFGEVALPRRSKSA